LGQGRKIPYSDICNKESNLEPDESQRIDPVATGKRAVTHGVRNITACPWGIREQQKTYPDTVLCKVMEVSAYYAWVKTPEHTDKTRQKAVLEAKARQLFDDHKQTYGYRRLSDALGKAGMKSG
jgi:hypothetical protein